MNPETAAHKFHHNYMSLFLKKFTFQLFLFLSFLLSLTSALSYFSYSYYFSAFVFPLLSHTLDRKYMFLLCTGILTFLTKSSRFRLNVNTDVYGLPEMDLDGPVLEDINLQQAEEEKEEEEEEADGHENEEKLLQEPEERKVVEEETKNGDLIDGNEGEDDDGGSDHEEEDGWVGASWEEGNEVNMNTEELNKKIEEFIKKMKEELRIEAQQHLITV